MLLNAFWIMKCKNLRVNVSKNQGKLKKSGHCQKIDCAHTLSVWRPR